VLAPQPSAAPASPLPAPATNARPKRYSTSPKSLAQSPRLLLWAAGGLVALIVVIRLAFGPAQPARSPSVIVHVPEVTTELAASSQAPLELSEQALIGGDIKRVKRVPLAAAPAEQLALSEAQLQAANPSAQALPALAADEPEAEPDAQADSAAIRTVSAVSVQGGLARAAANRPPAATSGNPEPPAPVDYKAQGRELYKAGKFREAADAYQRATQRDAADASAFAGLGGSLLAIGDTKKAITAYQRAVRLEPAVSGFQAALGRAYLKKGDRARARAAYSKALKLDPKNQAARTGMANSKTR
jgi:tetratricopeptide (TPR) repeat protein